MATTSELARYTKESDNTVDRFFETLDTAIGETAYREAAEKRPEFFAKSEIETMSVEALERLMQTLVLLDYCVYPPDQRPLNEFTYKTEGDTRIYAYDKGTGDEFFVRIADNGEALIIGFDHESELNQFAADEVDEAFLNHIYAGLPERWRAVPEQPELDGDATRRELTTFCLWYTDGRWVQHKWTHGGDDDGGQDFLLSMIFPTAETWYERNRYFHDLQEGAARILPVVRKIYDTRTLTAEDIRTLNPDIDEPEDEDEVLDEIRRLDMPTI